MKDCIKVIQGLSADFKIGDRLYRGEGGGLKLLLTFENKISKHSVRQSKLALNTP